MDMIPDQKMMYVSRLYPKWDNDGEFWFTANAIGKIAVNTGFDKIFQSIRIKAEHEDGLMTSLTRIGSVINRLQ